MVDDGAKKIPKNSGKAPSFQFYPNDWSRDLEEHPLEIEGAWMRIVCKLWYSETRGTLTKSVEQWGRILRVSTDKAQEILNYINCEKIGDVTQRNGKSNAPVTVSCRRMVRDEKLREQNRLRQKRHRGKKDSNANVTDDVTRVSQASSSSSSSSSSTSIDNIDSQKRKKERKRTQAPMDEMDANARWWLLQEKFKFPDSEKKHIVWLIRHYPPKAINEAEAALQDRKDSHNPPDNPVAYFTECVKYKLEDVPARSLCVGLPAYSGKLSD